LLVGGGLANGLLASRLRIDRPELDFLVLEAGPTLGGNHTWSFHETDVRPDAMRWLVSLGAQRFSGGHDVIFQRHARTLRGDYASLRSHHFHAALHGQLGARARLGARASEVGATHVVLDNGERLEARAVIDARALPPQWPSGSQNFLGQDLELAEPHGLARPLLMDATVEQSDGFCFIYALPWDERRVLVEDTHYANTPALELEASRARIRRWVDARGWTIVNVEREEHAALPIPLRGDAPQLARPMLGVSAGFFHATTGYSLPFAVTLAERIAALENLDAEHLTTFLNDAARSHWRRQRFFRLLNRMLFLGTSPHARERIFSAFYEHDEALIARFYSGQFTLPDMLSALSRGAATVATLPALRAASAW
ncbi:MAG: lycopene beta-cyclase CrtY, partial [Archangium sp.]|nr:lycopene beta-cyclase CrtY [Archangium sp.]